MIFLYPTHRPVDRNNTEDPPAQTDSLVRGLVELYVPSPRHISGIKVKLRAIQTVAILDANTGVIPVSWEDEVLMEKEVFIGMQPKVKKDKERGRSERGRTPGPSGLRSQTHGSRPPSLDFSTESRFPSRQPSRAPSRDVTARNSLENPRGEAPGYTEDSHEDDHQGLAASIGSAFARAVSRGRTPHQSQPGSRRGSRSRAASPAAGDRRNKHTAASANNSRSGSATPSIVTPSPLMSPREERARPDLTPSSSRGRISDDVDVGSLAISGNGDRNRRTSSGLGHPDDEDFGLHRPANFSRNNSDSSTPGAPRRPSLQSSASHGPGSFGKKRDASKGSSVPPQVGKSGQRSASKGWPRWGRSVSRARVPAPQKDGSAATSHRNEHGDEDHPPDGIELEKGVHGFEFAFIIPADSSEYTRSPFGRVRYVIKATAYGAGRAKSNLESWRDCFPVSNPSMEGGPTPLTVLYNDLHPTVGLLSIACTAQNISVGGLFQMDIHSPTPPPDLYIYMVRVCLDTTIELKTKRKGKQVVPTQRHKLYEKGYVPPSKNDPHGEGDGKKAEGYVRDPTRDGAQSAWTVQGLARMPDDNSIRASTIGGTKSAIRFSHVLIVEVVHSREATVGEDRKLKVFTLRQPITLPSCCVAFDAATLPAYTANDDDPTRVTVGGLPYDLAHSPDGAIRQVPNTGGQSGGAPVAPRPSTLKPVREHGHENCVCGLSLQDLEVRERAMIPVSNNYDIPINNLRPHGKIGEMPLGRTRSRSTTRARRRSSVSSQRSVSRPGGRRGSGSSGVAGALARSISRGGPSGRGRSPSIGGAGSGSGGSGSERRSSSIARSRTRDSTGAGTSAVGGELTGGTSIARNASRGSSRLGMFSNTASSEEAGADAATMTTATMPSSSSTASVLPRPPPTSATSTALDSSVAEAPSTAGPPHTETSIVTTNEPPSYLSALQQVDEEALDTATSDEDDGGEGGAEMGSITRGRRSVR